MKKQFLVAVLGLVVSVSSLATTPIENTEPNKEATTEENQLPASALPQIMSCVAVNAFGVAKMTYVPETRTVISIVNGYIQTKYQVVSSDSRLNTGFKVIAGKAYSMLVMKEPDALESDHGYLLIFNQQLKLGAQRVSGHLASALLTDVAQSLFNPAMIVPVNYTPISTLTCDIVF